MSRGHEKARRDLLTDLSAGQQEGLVHLLSCPGCREHLASRLPLEPDETNELLVPGLRLPLLDTEALLAEAATRMEEAHQRLGRILVSGPRERARLLQDESFVTDELLALALQRGREALPWNPAEARALSRIAHRGAGCLYRRLLDPEEAALWHVEAELLRGNAERLSGRLEAAGNAFTRAALFLRLAPGNPLAGGDLCRWQGVLFWERGDFDLGEGLLRQSARIYEEYGPPAEEAASRVLLGLLLAERGDGVRAARLLQAGRVGLDAGEWPILAVRSRLALALELARLGHLDWARPLLDPLPAAEEERVRADAGLEWLFGEAVARVVGLQEGERRLEEAWNRLLTRSDLPLAVLCGLDLAAVKVELGSGREAVEAILRGLESSFPGDSAVTALAGWAAKALHSGEAERLGEADVRAEAAAYVRRVLRLRGHRVQPPL